MNRSPGRPRSGHVDEHVRTAVRALLVEEGYAAVSVERVAREAGVAKTAIYRRWGSKPEMVFAAVVHGTDVTPPADLGDLGADLEALTAHVIDLLSNPVARHAVPGLVAEMGSDPALSDRFRAALIDPERRVVETILSRARERGSAVPPGAAQDVHAELLGTVFAWIYLVGGERPRDLAARVARSLVASLHAQGEQ